MDSHKSVENIGTKMTGFNRFSYFNLAYMVHDRNERHIDGGQY